MQHAGNKASTTTEAPVYDNAALQVARTQQTVRTKYIYVESHPGQGCHCERQDRPTILTIPIFVAHDLTEIIKRLNKINSPPIPEIQCALS